MLCYASYEQPFANTFEELIRALGAEPASCFHSPTRNRRRSGGRATASADSASPAQIAAAIRHGQTGRLTRRGGQLAHAGGPDPELQPSQQGQHSQLSKSAGREIRLPEAACVAGSAKPREAPHELLPLRIGRPATSSISTHPASTVNEAIHHLAKRQRVSFACDVSDKPDCPSSENSSHVEHTAFSGMASRCSEEQQSANAGTPATMFGEATCGIIAYSAQRADQARSDQASTGETRAKQALAVQVAARQTAARKRAAETLKALLPPPGYFADHVQPGCEANVAHFRALLAAHPQVMVNLRPSPCPCRGSASQTNSE